MKTAKEIVAEVQRLKKNQDMLVQENAEYRFKLIELADELEAEAKKIATLLIRLQRARRK